MSSVAGGKILKVCARLYSDYDDAVELLGQHWCHNVEELLSLRGLLCGRYFELRYEHLINDVRWAVSAITDFAEVDTPDDWLASLHDKLPSMNDKWRQELSLRQIELLYKQISPLLAR
jgi:hypothetical protein